MAGTFYKDFMAFQPLGNEAAIMTGYFTDDTTTADVVVGVPYKHILYADAKQDDAANAHLKVTIADNSVTFESPTSGKKYRCIIIAKP